MHKNSISVAYDRANVTTEMILRKPDGSEEVIDLREAQRRGLFANIVSAERVKAA